MLTFSRANSLCSFVLERSHTTSWIVQGINFCQGTVCEEQS